MAKKIVPTHKYKTTILFYDDDINYLTFLKENLRLDNYNILFVNNIEEFNRCIKHSEKIRLSLPNPFVKIDNEVSDNPRHDLFNFNISKFDELRAIPNKSDEISTVFIDNNLNSPDYDGFSICENMLKNLSFNKVLLTGANDREKAINAFSHKNINLYIEKFGLDFNSLTDVNIIEKITNSLNKLTDRFFINTNNYTNELLVNNNFKKLFDLVNKQNNTADYFLFDKEAFLLIDSDGKYKYLRCWDESKFDEYFKLHFDELNPEMFKELDKIKSKIIIPTDQGAKQAIQFNGLFYCTY